MTFARHALVALMLAACLQSPTLLGQTDADGAWLEQYREAANRIIGEAMADRFAWNRLAELTDRFGPRLSGTPQLEAAIRWSADEMRRDGLENVRTEEVMVPRWVRGHESLEVVGENPRRLAMLGLGGSVGTAPEGLKGEIFVVHSFDELESRSKEVEGRIVVFNQPFVSYGETVAYRSGGASRAARYGAIAALVRSIGPDGLRTPHTGGMRYQAGVPHIPTAALAAEDADWLDRLTQLGSPVTVRLTMEATTMPDSPSANVIAEIRGRELPDEVVVVGGHIDSWDVGAGASDDGGGCIVTWEALRIMQTLGLRPRRTVRLVLFTNEENGTRGGIAYRDRYRDSLSGHVLMFESDSGLFDARGFGFSGNQTARRTVQQIASLLDGIGMTEVGPSGGGADIGPSVREENISAMSLLADDSQYVLIHHTPADTVDKIDPMDVSRAAAAVAVITYIVADMPTRLGQTSSTRP